MSWHEVLDECSYEMHRVIADILREDPAKLNISVGWIQGLLSDPEYSVRSKDALTEWLELIRSGGVEAVLAVLEDPGENATRLRHASPFAVLMPQAKRTEILRRHEARRSREHSAGI